MPPPLMRIVPPPVKVAVVPFLMTPPVRFSVPVEEIVALLETVIAPA